jgi:hypothetical protein
MARIQGGLSMFDLGIVEIRNRGAWYLTVVFHDKSLWRFQRSKGKPWNKYYDIIKRDSNTGVICKEYAGETKNGELKP